MYISYKHVQKLQQKDNLQIPEDLKIAIVLFIYELYLTTS